MSLNRNQGFTIVAGNLNGENTLLFCHMKLGMMMDSGEKPPANEGVELR